MSILERADGLQHAWLLPFELIDLTPELESDQLAVIADDGTLFVPNDGRGYGEAELDLEMGAPPRRFGYAIAARIHGREEVLATHTWAEPAACQRLSEAKDEAAAWLLRVELSQQDEVVGCLCLRGPEPIRPRLVAEGPTAVLSDLGMVLLHFDRSRFPAAFHLMFGEAPKAAGLALTEEIRPRFERGELSIEDWVQLVLKPLGLIPPDRDCIQRVWASIFQVKRSTVRMMRWLAAQPQITVVIVSNTDPIHARNAREQMGLEDLTWNMVASCQDGVNPKGTDGSMWLRALNLAEHSLQTRPEQVIAIDDIRPYLRTARESGAVTHTVHYRHFAQCKYELGVCGLYVPLNLARDEFEAE